MVDFRSIIPTNGSGYDPFAQQLDDAWTHEVADIRSFLDENYFVSLGGSNYSMVDLTHSQHQLSWGRVGIDKWSERVIPLLSLDDDSDYRAVLRAIKSACKDAIAFGNSTIIIDADGQCRVSVPESSMAWRDLYGQTYFKEVIGSTCSFSSSMSGLALMTSINGNDPVDTGSRTFSIFYRQDGAHPFGASRLSQSVRSSIREASRNKIRGEIASNFYAFPQRYLNGAWANMDPGIVSGATTLASGVGTIQVIPKNPDSGETLNYGQFDASDFTPFIEQQKQLATEVAAGLNLGYDELGVVTTKPQSADAIYATKESLSLSISEWEDGITETVQYAIQWYETCRQLTTSAILTWREPATPSKASAADAAVKIISAFPALKDSTAVMAWAGLPPAVLREVTREINGSTYDPDSNGTSDTVPNDDNTDDTLGD
ncbi:MAG: hypothetical protein WCS21_10495 [Lachnospiraceae bacterium]